ncbi:hypothetical protein [Plantactinospora sp. B5E13]|uniref:hypothetical protein n=1 Tax=unclassified Plantactinospora TaxID=2631981 RepID=UPI00325CF1E5
MADPDALEGVALARVLRQAGGAEILNTLGVQLSGADLVALLLAAFRTRAGFLSPADVLRRYTEDRFVAPAPVDFRVQRRVEDRLLSAVPDEVELVTLAPVTPLGAHSTVAGVHQNNVLATVRGSEVAADPTTGLALEAAVRRRDRGAGARRGAPPVRLAALQRVIRARRSAGADRFAHANLFALATAGADSGGLGFERRHSVEQLGLLCTALRATGVQSVEVGLTLLDPAAGPVTEAVRSALRDRPDVVLREVPEPVDGPCHHTGWCFRLAVLHDGVRVEVGDGGFVDWTRRLLGRPRERLLVSVLGVDRLSALVAEGPAG